jgi:hypothetical protein
MRRSSLLFALVLAACPGGDAGIGDHCGESSDCQSSLQCVDSVCVPQCKRAPDCGDGFACDKDGLCQKATGGEGDDCTSEIDCATGLACELSGGLPDAQGHLGASCTAENPGRPAGATCEIDRDCRDGTCALGHCTDLCRDTRDCAEATSCTQIPRVEANGAMYNGCLQSSGSLRWSIPISAPSQTVLLPSPASARELAVTLSVDDPDQKVGATSLISPSGVVEIDPTKTDPYTNLVRHFPELGQATMVIASSPAAVLEAGAYSMTVSSLRPVTGGTDSTGTATPRVTVVAKLDESVLLDLHFYFLDLDDHPCSAAFGDTLTATTAQTAPFFQQDYLGMLRQVFAHGGVTLGSTTYEDLRDHPDLDGLDVNDAPSLLALGAHDGGINVFFVRTLRPVGLQAFGPNPGPAGLAGTRQSGVVVALDTLCYPRSGHPWADLARLSAHELARYMGLYDNVDLDGHPDPIGDDDAADPSTNLMFYSDMGGVDLSDGQRDILGRSPVLR